MAKTKKPDEVKVEASEVTETPVMQTPDPEARIESPLAPETPEPQFQTEYSTENVVRQMHIYPSISAGRCEWCGSLEYIGGQVTQKVLANGTLSYSYKGGRWEPTDATKCKHYKNVNIRCTYCGEQFTAARNRAGVFTEILGTRNVFVGAFPESPRTLVMWCAAYECMTRHHKRIGLIK